MKLNKCPCCGANVGLKINFCEYCGSSFILENTNTNKTDRVKLEATPYSSLNDFYKNIAQPDIKTDSNNNSILTKTVNNNSNNYVKKTATNKFGIAAFVFAILGLAGSFSQSSFPILFIISLFLVKKQNTYEKNSLTNTAKFISIAGIIIWIIVQMMFYRFIY